MIDDMDMIHDNDLIYAFSFSFLFFLFFFFHLVMFNVEVKP